LIMTQVRSACWQAGINSRNCLEMLLKIDMKLIF